MTNKYWFSHVHSNAPNLIVVRPITWQGWAVSIGTILWLFLFLFGLFSITLPEVSDWVLWAVGAFGAGVPLTFYVLTVWAKTDHSSSLYVLRTENQKEGVRND
jgi:hypothetical protein